MKPVRLSFAVLFIATALMPVQAQWERTTFNGARSGAVYSLCVKDSWLFAGTDAGVFRSSDQGTQWTKVNPLLPPRYYLPLAYSVSANGADVIAAFMETGVYMSSDYGETWRTGLAVYGRSSPTEIAAGGSWIIVANPIPFNMSRQSTDNGETWGSLPMENLISVAIQDSIALAGTSSGLYRSSDYGGTWAMVRQMSFYAPVTGNTICLSGENAFLATQNYTLSSHDRGLTWQDSSALNCTSINAIVCSPTAASDRFVFAATDSGMFRSPYDGLNWTSVNNGLTSPLIFSLALKSGETGQVPILFAGTGNGIFQSTDDGDTWTLTGSPGDWVVASSEGGLFAVSSNSSSRGYSKYTKSSEFVFQTTVIHSTDFGEHWTDAFTGLLDDSARVTSICAGENGIGDTRLFAAGVVGGTLGMEGVIFASANQGIQWTKVFSDVTIGNASLLGANGSTVFAGLIGKSVLSGGLFRTTDNGNSWERIDTTLRIGRAICFDGGEVFAGESDDYITIVPPRRVKTVTVNRFTLSTDNGETWTRIETPIDTGKEISTNADTMSIMTSLYSDWPHLLVGMKAKYFQNPPYASPVANGGGLYHLYRGDSTWVLADSSLMGRQVFCFAAEGSCIIAGTDSGVFRTTDYGTTWHDVSAGMNRLNVSSLFFSGPYLFASTTNGLWKRPSSQVTSVEDIPPGDVLPRRFALFQNSPNPFNPTTVIRFELPVASLVSLRVFDLLGREIATLVRGEMGGGYHETEWNARDAASGLYLCRLEVSPIGNSQSRFVETRKMLLLR